MFAKIVQKWKDFKDYWRAVRDVDVLSEKADLLRKTVTGPLSNGGADNYCIGQKMGYLSVHNNVCDLSSEMVVPFVQDYKYCPHTMNATGRFTVPCDKTSCQCCAANHEYVAALAEYKNAQQKLRVFKKRNSRTK